MLGSQSLRRVRVQLDDVENSLDQVEPDNATSEVLHAVALGLVNVGRTIVQAYLDGDVDD